MERLHDSYRHFGRLAAAQLTFSSAARGAMDVRIDSLLARRLTRRRARQSSSVPEGAADLGLLLLRAPHEAVYPPMPMSEEGARAGTLRARSPRREHDVFAGLVAQGGNRSTTPETSTLPSCVSEILGRCRALSSTPWPKLHRPRASSSRPPAAHCRHFGACSSAIRRGARPEPHVPGSWLVPALGRARDSGEEKRRSRNPARAESGLVEAKPTPSTRPNISY